MERRSLLTLFIPTMRGPGTRTPVPDFSILCNRFTAMYNRWLSEMIEGKMNVKLWKETKHRWGELVKGVEENV